MKLVEESHAMFYALLIKCLQYHMAGSVGRVASTSHRLFGNVVGMSSKWTLCNPALLCAVERQTHVLQFIDNVNSLIAHDLDRILVRQVVTTLDGIERVPFWVVFLVVAKRRAHSSLGRSSVRARRIELRDNSRLYSTRSVKRGHQSCTASADNYCIVLVIHRVSLQCG